MNILFELSKEHPTLPQNEIFACLTAEDISYIINETNNDILNISTNTDIDLVKNIVSRLSHTFYVDELFFSCSNSIDEIKKNAKKYFIDLPGSIAIRYKNTSKNKNSQEIIKIIQEIYTRNKKVNLTDPDNEIRVFITDLKVYVGKKIIVIDRSQYEKRKVQFRPYFSPISLHPKIARALVNLSCVKKNETLLDPFCGTGGILLEAGLIGAKVIGSDIEEKMIYGSKETLDFYKLKNYQLFCSDIGDIKKHINYVDAIVTDLPYGKATTTKGEDMNKLYTRTFEVLPEILKEKKKAVIGISDKKWATKLYTHLKLMSIHEFRAHKSLTRYFIVFEKQP
ncbi:MAG: methyltransferase domain-containing protein [Candidatus Thermoplasmatota archaeon]|nr:methyltransferase domain-containing protein [Candidatus Thermoplasmatota archaeon]